MESIELLHSFNVLSGIYSMFFLQSGKYIPAFFPKTHFAAVGSADFFLKVLLLFAAFSGGYLCVAWLIARFFPVRRRRISMGMSSGYVIGVLLASFAIADQAKGSVYLPIYQIAALIILNAGLIIALLGRWFTTRKEADPPLSMWLQVRAGYWYSLLTTSLLWLVIFLQVPVVSRETHTLFWGPLAFALVLYYLLSKVFVAHGYKLLGLQVAESQWGDELRDRITSVKEFIAELGPYQLVLLGRGVRSAFAVYPQGKIMLGIELFQHLEAPEMKAVMLHEIGHLQDRKFVHYRHRIGQLLPFLMVGFLVMDQGKVFPSPLVESAVLLLGIFGFAMVLKRLTLKGEFVADRFAKEFPGNFHPHLLSALAKIYTLNGLDRDFCKKSNYAHLDIDERQKMVETGTFAVKRKPVRSFFLTFIPFMILGVALQFGWSSLFPSPGKQWKTFHNRYHRLFNARSYEEAEKTLGSGLDLSLRKFGEVDRHTYILLKDYARFFLRQKKPARSEEFILRAEKVGEQLYGAASLRRKAEWKIHARIRRQQNKIPEAKSLYTAILAVQQQQGDTPYNISRTLYSLAAISDGRPEIINYYQQIIQLYKEASPEDGESPSEYIFSDLAEMYTEDGLPEKAEALLNEAVELVRQKKGATSDAYAGSILDLAYFLQRTGKYARAEELFKQCQSIGSGNDGDTAIGAGYGLAENYRLQDKLAMAEKELHRLVRLEEKKYGQNSQELIYGLTALASLARQHGDQAQEEALWQRIQRLEDAGE
ncbi:MAG: hypothetical protein DSY50_03415 [Desulfobulbus sp.]|nr:MAG: hypothetical protein DSY50_03415 [Desulfobulbus sp.]